MRTMLLVLILAGFSGVQAFQVLPSPGTARRNILPSPVCFLLQGQVHRLAGDGETLERITDEEEPVASFDVSPASGELAYVSGNSLIHLSRNGQRRVLLQGGALPSTGTGTVFFNDREVITGRIASPRWSPDGSSIAFIRDGLLLFDPVTGDVTALHLNDTPSSTDENGSLVLHGIDSWSPDGGRILVSCYEYPLASVFSLFMGLCDTAGNLVFLQEGVGTSGWSRDGSTLFIGYPSIGGATSLCRLEPPEWQSVLIGQEVPARNYYFYQAPSVTPDGSVNVFIAGGSDPMDSDGFFSLYRVNSRGEGAELLRLDSYTLREVLWAADGSGALLTDGEGKLYWVPAGDGRASLLPVTGAEMLRWSR